MQLWTLVVSPPCAPADPTPHASSPAAASTTAAPPRVVRHPVCRNRCESRIEAFRALTRAEGDLDAPNLRARVAAQRSIRPRAPPLSLVATTQPADCTGSPAARHA